jgi:hypothetical protein
MILMLLIYLFLIILHAFRESKIFKFHPTSACFLISVINALNVRQISHKINRLSFGDYFPGVVNPLDR